MGTPRLDDRGGEGAGGASSGGDISRLIRRLHDGEPTAWDELFQLVYDELRRIARRQLRAQRADHTLSTTALVHEAYLKLVDPEHVRSTDRVHFLAVAARAMRQVLIDYARRHTAAKRGGQWQRMTLREADLVADQRADDLLTLDEALTQLERLNDRLSRVVEYRFFGGLTEDETAEALGVTPRTVRRDWVKARAWLYATIHGDGE